MKHRPTSTYCPQSLRLWGHPSICSQAAQFVRSHRVLPSHPVIAEWSRQGSVDELVNYWFSCCKLNPETIHLVQELHAQGIRCSLATNQEAYRATYLRKTIRLGTVFDELFVSAEIGYTKNDVRFFEAVYHQLSKTLGAIERASVLFADHEEQSLTAASTFGFSTHNYSNIRDFRAAIAAGPIVNIAS